ncbi:MAG: hypothetical protein OXH50_21190 [Gemmatimonadetes bacterium]|nr:hypothetical protein [Gemmatimonadota bacterium]
MTAASRKFPFAVIAFLALAWPSAGEDPGRENDYGRDSIGGMKGAIEAGTSRSRIGAIPPWGTIVSRYLREGPSPQGSNSRNPINRRTISEGEAE